MGKTIASLVIDITAGVATFKKDLQDATKDLDKFGRQLSSFGSRFNSLSLPIAGVAAASLKMAGDFETSMNNISARGGITGDALKKLEKQAMDLGASTSFSAKEAADGMGELAAAGMDASQITAAMPGVLDMAAAAQVDLGRASGIVVSTLGQFGLEASESGRVADVMAKAAAMGVLSMSDLAETMKYAGSVADGLGLSLEETSAAIALLSNKGIKGSEAGTALRAGLLEIQSKGKELEKAGLDVLDPSGKIKSLNEVLQQFAKANLSTVDIMDIVGKEATSAWQSLISQVREAPTALSDATTQLQNCQGAAKTMADALMKGLNGALQGMTGAIETAAIGLGKILAPAAIQFAEMMQGIAAKVSEFADYFQTLPQGVQTFSVALVGITAAAGPVAIALGAVVAGVTALSLPFTAAAAAVTLGGGALIAFVASSESAQAAISGLWEWVKGVADWGAIFTTAFRTAEDSLNIFWISFKTGFSVGWEIAKVTLSGIATLFSDAAKGFVGSMQWMIKPMKAVADAIFNAFGWLFDKIASKIDGIKTAVKGVISYLPGVEVEVINGVKKVQEYRKNKRAERKFNDLPKEEREKREAEIKKAVDGFQTIDITAQFKAPTTGPAIASLPEPKPKIDEPAIKYTPKEKGGGEVSKAEKQAEKLEKKVAKIKTDINDLFADEGMIADPLREQLKGLISAGDIEGIKSLAEAFSTNEEKAARFKDALSNARSEVKELADSQKDLGEKIAKAFDDGTRSVTPLEEKLKGLFSAKDRAGIEAYRKEFVTSTEKAEEFGQALEHVTNESKELESRQKTLKESIDSTFGVSSNTGISELGKKIADLASAKNVDGIREIAKSFQTSDKNTEEFTKALKEAEDYMDDLNDQSVKWAETMTDAFTQLGEALGLSKEGASSLSSILAGAFSGKGESGTMQGIGATVGNWFSSLWKGDKEGESKSPTATEQRKQEDSMSSAFSSALKGAGSYFSSWFGGSASSTTEASTQVVSSADQMGPFQNETDYKAQDAKKGGGGGYNWGDLAEGFATGYEAYKNVKPRDGTGYVTDEARYKAMQHEIGKGALNAWIPGLGDIVTDMKAMWPEFFDKLENWASPSTMLIEALFGENEDTSARKGMEQWIEKRLKESGKSLFQHDGEGKGNIEKWDGDIIRGRSDRFNNPRWAAEFQTYGAEAQSTFNGISVALKELLGVTEDVAGQMAVVLAESLNGSIDNARLLVQNLGVSLEEMEGALVAAGEAGRMSWHEVEVALQGVHQAYGEGLVEHGAFSDAFRMLIDSAGRGQEAIKGFRDIAIEAQEGGIKTLEELKKLMLQKGLDPAEVNSLFQALEQRGIKTLEEWANATTRVAGGVIADMQSLNSTLADKWAEASQQLEQFNEELGKIPDESTKNVTFNVEANISDDARAVLDSQGAKVTTGLGEVKKAARGAIVNGPMGFQHGGGLGLMGEAGPEAILPLTRVGGRLGVAAIGATGGGGGVVYNIDARGAGPGVGAEIRRALMDVEERAVSRAVSTISHAAGRGGRMGSLFGG